MTKTMQFYHYHELGEKGKVNAHLNYCSLVEDIPFIQFEAQEAGKHIYLRTGTYADTTVGGASILAICGTNKR